MSTTNAKIKKTLNILCNNSYETLFILFDKRFGINNVILQGKVEDKILNKARQRHITEKNSEFWDMELHNITASCFI